MGGPQTQALVRPSFFQISMFLMMNSRSHLVPRASFPNLSSRWKLVSPSPLVTACSPSSSSRPTASYLEGKEAYRTNLNVFPSNILIEALVFNRPVFYLSSRATRSMNTSTPVPPAKATCTPSDCRLSPLPRRAFIWQRSLVLAVCRRRERPPTMLQFLAVKIISCLLVFSARTYSLNWQILCPSLNCLIKFKYSLQVFCLMHWDTVQCLRTLGCVTLLKR